MLTIGKESLDFAQSVLKVKLNNKTKGGDLMKKSFVFVSYVGCDGHVIERTSIEKLENPPITLGEYEAQRKAAKK